MRQTTDETLRRIAMKRFQLSSVAAILMVLIGFGPGVTEVFAQDEIHFDGSSQMYWAFVKDSADAFSKEAGVKVTAEDRKTQDAVPSLVSGRCNVGGMARKMKLAEKAQGQDLVETLIARDRIAVFVPKEIQVADVSLEDLKKVFAGQIADWKDLGEAAGPIQVVIPQTKTASNNNFSEIVMKGAPFAQSSLITDTAGGVLDEIKGKRAISFISFGAVSNRAEFRVLKVDGKLPSDDTYPIAQEMYFVTKGQPADNIKKYVDFFLNGTGKDVILKAGLLPAR